MLPKTGKKLHSGGHGPGPNISFAELIAAALKTELGSSHQAVKTIQRWTGAGERTVKNWLAGSFSPSGEHLVDLARHSDGVLRVFLVRADRQPVMVMAKILAVRDEMRRTAELIDQLSTDASAPHS